MTVEFNYSCNVNFETGSMSIGIDDAIVELTFLETKNLSPVIKPVWNGYHFIFKDIYDGVDVKYICTKDKMKEFFYVKKNSKIKDIKIKLNTVKCGLLPNRQDQRLEVVDEDGNVVFFFEKPFVIKNKRRDQELSSFLSMDFNQDSRVFALSFDEEMSKSFPLTIDPTFIFNTKLKKSKVLIYDNFNHKNTMLVTGTSFGSEYMREIESLVDAAEDPIVNERGSLSVLSDDVVFERQMRIMFPMSSPSQVKIMVKRGRYETYEYSSLLTLAADDLTIGEEDFIYSYVDFYLPFSASGSFVLSCLFQGNSLSLGSEDASTFGHYRAGNAVEGSSVLYQRVLSYIPEIDIGFPGDSDYLKSGSGNGIKINNLYIQNRSSFLPFKYYLIPYSLNGESTNYLDIIENGLDAVDPHRNSSTNTYFRGYFHFDENTQYPTHDFFVAYDFDDFDPDLDFVGDGHRIENAFTFIGLPDTQYYSESFPAVFTSQTQWIADKKREYNIKHVFHYGDITDDDTSAQWVNANTSLSILEDAKIPFSVLRGNHDAATTYYDQYFPPSRFSDKPYWGGSYSSTNNDHNYQLVEIEGTSYIFISLSYNPVSLVRTWASNLLSTYSDRIGIITTHSYMEEDGTGLTSIGQDIWDDVVDPNSNARVVLCGHSHSSTDAEELLITANSGGYNVYQVHSDYQERDSGGNGWLKVFQIVGENMYIRTYSPYLDQWEDDGDSYLGPFNLNSITDQEESLTFSRVRRGGLTSVANDLVVVLESAVNNRNNAQEESVFSRRYWSISRDDFVVKKATGRAQDVNNISLRLSMKPYFTFMLNDGATIADFYAEHGKDFGIKIDEMTSSADAGGHTKIEFSTAFLSQEISNSYTENEISYNYKDIENDVLKNCFLFAEINGSIFTYKILHSTDDSIIIKGRKRAELLNAKGISAGFFNPDKLYFERNGSNVHYDLNKSYFGVNGHIIYTDILYETSQVDGAEILQIRDEKSGFTLDKQIDLFSIDIVR